ncbi:MAG: hypothetical protein JJU29_23120 [Verrucomicrobia bacterium]|nr:hypothetical protein [Verrucomicrobiota bacterium]MCH8514211.1 hypothetical protein [Kiritimatiellia bacterium]
MLKKPYCAPPYTRDFEEDDFFIGVQNFAFQILRLHLAGQSDTQARFEAWRACLAFLAQCGRSYAGQGEFYNRIRFHGELFSDLKDDPFVSQFTEKQLGVMLELYTGLDSDVSDAWAWALLNTYQIFVNIERFLKEYTVNRQSGMLFLALLKYERAIGALPASLAELVPDYLAELPMDPYDGNLMRYQPEQRRFYSVGQNGVDDGGLEVSRSWQGDLVVTLPVLEGN